MVGLLDRDRERAQLEGAGGRKRRRVFKHDFVVRQYTQAGSYPAGEDKPQTLALRSIAATPGHQRQVNLVVFDKKTGETLQALSLQCAG